MIRYIKQNDQSSCGPIAIINTLKWLGHNATYQFIHIIRQLCNWKDARFIDGGGTTDADFEIALEYFKIKRKKIIAPNIDIIDYHLDLGGAVIISYFNPFKVSDFEKNSGHFTLCIGRTRYTYIMVNDKPGKTMTRRTKNTMKKMLSNVVDGEECCVWLIYK